jgi:hypothetical protein
MGEFLYPIGANIVLSCTIEDSNTPANNPIISAVVVASIRRFSDDKWWNFTDSTWDTVTFAALTAEHKATLADKGDGSYEADWNQATADASAERQYLAYYKVTSAGNFLNRVTTDVLTFAVMSASTAGTGTHTYTITVKTAAGVVFEGVKVTVNNPTETGTEHVVYTNALGVATFYLDADDWRAIAAANGYQAGAAVNFTVAAAGNTNLIVVQNTVAAPAAAGYCAVRCVNERRTDTDPSGTFVFVKGTSPATREASGVTVRLVDGEESKTLVAGVATINILQGVVCDLQVRTTGQKPVDYKQVLIPALSNVDVEDLVPV